MKPVTYDFDVITDAPAPKSRASEQTEPAPQAEAEDERKRASPPERDGHVKVRAAE